MSELINKSGRREIRLQLLMTVSALALVGQVCAAPDANADGDAGRPVLWIELGGQFEQQTGQSEAFSPSFAADNSGSSEFLPGSFAHLEKPSPFGSDAEAKLTFQPSGSDWVFSAAVRYGRSNGHKTIQRTRHLSHVYHVTFRSGHIHYTPFGSVYYTHTIQHATGTQTKPQFAAGQAAQSQTHAIVDFTAGRDVGLGMFGSGSTSSFSVGLRYAQFNSKASGAINENNPIFTTSYNTYFQHRFPSHPWREAGFATYLDRATFQNQRSFHGIGPSLSWNASLPVLGEKEAGTLNVDWGANAAALFGRQRASGSHQISVDDRVDGYKSNIQHTSVGGFNRSRAVIVPNAGGFAGLSFNFTNAKVALGYRGDFFFGAMDTGNDTRKTKAVSFYGPFATVSIGIGG